MALKKIAIGTNPDGSVHWLYQPDDPANSHVVYTGPISGSVKTSDGTSYDVGEAYIEVKSAEHAGEVSHAIGMRHEAEGHPLYTGDVPFVHECSDHCGALAVPEKMGKTSTKKAVS